MDKLEFKAVIFDLDGVVTKTAIVHCASWKVMFDEYMREREARDNESFVEFRHEQDYLVYVDGKPRYKGVQSFLESRNINIEFGDPSDDPSKETVCALGNRKNLKFREVLEKDGVEVYPSTIAFIKKLKDRGCRIGVASSSKNCQFIMQAANIEDLFETRVDGVVSAKLGLSGKPDPDIFVKACENLGIDTKDSIVVEDAVSGVQAGAKGGFGLVIGIARENNEEELKKNGADFVIIDFEGITIDMIEQELKEAK
ncbi:MAG: beta-phosphoglucomutase family hydrolase [Candidatus Zapsychrus exili]|nr:beta-phosphoglucomutase family hydrolase [Candidatus Zapsychrus exili]